MNETIIKYESQYIRNDINSSNETKENNSKNDNTKTEAYTDKIRKKLEKKQENIRIRKFKSEMRTFILTSRFNTETRLQNEKYRNQKWPNGCVYCTPEQISQKIPIDAKMIVLEMDNDKNTIFGAGMLLNKPFFNKHSVYTDDNYNRYSYIGKYRIKREELTEQEEAVFKALDILCFTGNDHMKRGHGLKSFPTKLLMNCSTVINMNHYIEDMFKRRFSK